MLKKIKNFFPTVLGAPRAPTNDQAHSGLHAISNRLKQFIPRHNPQRASQQQWIQDAIKHPGALRKTVRQRYGEKGFTKRGTIRVSVLHELANEPDVTGRQARLALTLREFHAPQIAVQNLGRGKGSIMAVVDEEGDYQQQMITKATYQVKEATAENLGDGTIMVTGKTKGNQEFNHFIQTTESLEALKRKFAHGIQAAPHIVIENLPRREKRKLRQEAREFLTRMDPNWENYSTIGKHRAITEEANRRLNPRHISVQFEHDLKKSYDLINEQKRAGNVVRIPDLWRELKDAGYSRAEFERELFRLEKERTIEMQAASQPRFIPEYDRKLGIPHSRRGHLNYVVWRFDPSKPIRR